MSYIAFQGLSHHLFLTPAKILPFIHRLLSFTSHFNSLVHLAYVMALVYPWQLMLWIPHIKCTIMKKPLPKCRSCNQILQTKMSYVSEYYNEGSIVSTQNTLGFIIHSVFSYMVDTKLLSIRDLLQIKRKFWLVRFLTTLFKKKNSTKTPTKKPYQHLFLCVGRL